MTNGAEDVSAGQAGVSWLGRNSMSEVVDVDGTGMVRLRKITVGYTDFTLDPDRGIYTAPVYTLQPGDWVYLAQIIVTEAFDDSLGNGTTIGLYPNTPGAITAVSVESSVSLPTPWGDEDLANADGGTSAEVYSVLDPKVPFTVYPGIATPIPLQLRVVDWANDGTQGSLYVALWLAEF